MNRQFIAVLAAISAVMVAGAATAACPTQPTNTGISGADFSAASQTVSSFSTGGKQTPWSMPMGWTGSTQDAFALDSSCNLDVNVQTGNVGATSTIGSPQSTPTISTSAYSTGMVIGGAQTFTSQPTTGIISNAVATFNSGSFSAGTVDLYIFNAAPTGGGVTDHAAFALTSTDTGKLIGVIHLNDCTSLGGTLSECQSSNTTQAYTLAASGTTITVVAVMRNASSITFAGASDATFSLNTVK